MESQTDNREDKYQLQGGLYFVSFPCEEVYPNLQELLPEIKQKNGSEQNRL